MFVQRTNGWKIVLRDGIWTPPGAEDITKFLACRVGMRCMVAIGSSAFLHACQANIAKAASRGGIAKSAPLSDTAHASDLLRTSTPHTRISWFAWGTTRPYSKPNLSDEVHAKLEELPAKQGPERVFASFLGVPYRTSIEFFSIQIVAKVRWAVEPNGCSAPTLLDHCSSLL